MTATEAPTPLHRTATAVILAGCLIALLGFGARSVMGLFLDPMTVANGWSRETFGLAMAIRMGSYDPVWWMGIALGVFAAIVHLPISEKPVARLAA